MTDWDEDIYQDPETEYQDFVRALKRKRGFGLYFVLCGRRRREDLITRLTKDLSSKQVEVIRLEEEIDNLYVRIAKLAEEKNNQVDILFIQGIEYSLYKYELKNFGQITEKEYHNYTNVPRILNHLNQQRERFRDDFPFSLVFILPSFALRYFLIRAGDFFDWRSTILELPKKLEDVEVEIYRLLEEENYEKYEKLTQDERTESTLYMLELLSEKDIKSEPTLCLEIGDWLAQSEEYQGAVKYYERLLQVKPDDYVAWNNQGNALFNLGKYQSAISSFDKALEIRPDLYQAWNNRGNGLFNLGEYQSAINSFDKALEIKPDYYSAWYNQGNTLSDFEEYEKAIESYDKAIQIKPNYHEAWNNRGNTLFNLGEYEKAIKSYNKALEIKPSYHEAWNNRGNALFNLREYQSAINSFDKARQIKPDYHEAWYNRGNALSDLKEYEQAIESYDKAIQIKPDLHQAWYNKARCYALQGDLELALENLKQAVNLDFENQELAKTDSDFDSIRHEEGFQNLLVPKQN